MSTFEPTPEQAAAIGHPLTDACVMAGAGSGKTAVLTQRFLELVNTHGLSVRRIAALTYTEKAAGEMRDRIAGALARAGRRDLAEEVEFASISTVHAFCARLLRLHAVEARVDPSFRVLAEPEGRLMREDCLTLALNELAAAGSRAPTVLNAVSLERRDLRLLLQSMRGAGVDVSELRAARGEGDPAECRRLAEEALHDLEQAVQNEEALTQERTGIVLRHMKAALADDRSDAWALMAAKQALRDAKPDGGKNGKRPFTNAKKQLREAIDQLTRIQLDDAVETDILPPLRDVLTAYDRVYERRKREEGALDFVDLELRALALLEQDGAASLGLGLQALLVDELQDTNPLQARLLDALRAGGCPLFGVGDPKQSIYRFRRADVRVIQEEWERVPEAGRYYLQATFRARPSLVDVLNGLTDSLFQHGAAGVDFVPLEARGAFREVGGADAELMIVDVGPGADADIRREAEARWIARRIRKLVDERVPRARRKEGEDERVLGFGDIAILLRARKDFGVYEDALRDEGIPFQTDKGKGFFQADEIVDLLQALRVVHDPADDFALACLLTGPAIAASDELLLRVFPDPSKGATPGGRAWEVLRDVEEARALVETVERLRREAATGHLGHVVEGVLHDLGLLQVALLTEDGGRRAMNLRKAVAVARGLEQAGRHGLGDLLRHLQTLRDLEVAEGEAASFEGAGDAVRVLTVHGSKGLEFPVVFLADVGRKAGASRAAFHFDAEDGLAVKLRDPLMGTEAQPGGWVKLADKEKHQDEAESLRLLYVAMTRAEERLFLTASSAGRLKGKPGWSQVQGWGKDLLESLETDPGFEVEELALGRGRLLVQAVSPPDPRPAANRGRLPADPPAPGAVDALLQKADAPTAPLGDTPYVVTVSELLRFAESPAAFYAHRLQARAAPTWGIPQPEDPASGAEHEDPDAARREERRAVFDEVHEEASSLDRAALGRALHRALERGDGLDEGTLAHLLAEEMAGEVPASAAELLLDMVRRFEGTATGRRVREAATADADLRRELRFHARVRFPRGADVAGFEHLLVRGAIDLWLPGPGGVEIVDYKTNPPSSRLPTPEDVRRLYDWQMRLYALAAERMIGGDVAGARLVLLDPGWGDDVPELEVDVSGDALEDARLLCRAFAIASLENRWPHDWHELLED